MNIQQQIVSATMGLLPEVLVSHPLEQYNESGFLPQPYEPTKNIEGQHHVWRGGHTNNFEAFVKGVSHSSEGTARDYIVGICAAAMLIFFVALLWFMVIVGLKVAGRKRVGFFAGRLVHPDFDATVNSGRGSGTLPSIQEEPEEENESLLDSEASSPLIISDSIDNDVKRAKTDKKFNRRVLFARVAFVLSGLCVMVCGILFYAKGVTSFHHSLSDVRHGLNLVQETSRKVINVTEGVLEGKNILSGDFNKTKKDVKGEVCNGAGALAEQIKELWAEVQPSIQELDEMVEKNIELFQSDLEQVIAMADDAEHYLHYADIFFGISITMSVIIMLLILAMLAVSFFSAKNIENCCTKTITYALIWPVFIFFLVLFWIFALLFLVTSLAGADFCVKPDQVVEEFLIRNEDKFSSVIFQFGIYYISGCVIKPVNEQFTELEDQISQSISLVHQFSELIMAQTPAALEAECGISNTRVATLQGGAKLIHDATHYINRAWIETLEVIECRNFNPIYTTFVHDALCINGVDGLTWLFTTSMLLFLFAMILIMFRAALYPVKRPPAQEENTCFGASLLSTSGGQ